MLMMLFLLQRLHSELGRIIDYGRSRLGMPPLEYDWMREDDEPTGRYARAVDESLNGSTKQ